MRQRLIRLLLSWLSKSSEPPLPPVGQAWVEGFGSGYKAAWETMMPLMTEGVHRAQAAIHDQAVEETLVRLDETIVQRLETSKQLHLRPAMELLSKREQFAIARDAAKEPAERQKYENYLTCLGWLLNGSNSHSD